MDVEGLGEGYAAPTLMAAVELRPLGEPAARVLGCRRGGQRRCAAGCGVSAFWPLRLRVVQRGGASWT